MNFEHYQGEESTSSLENLCWCLTTLTKKKNPKCQHHPFTPTKDKNVRFVRFVLCIIWFSVCSHCLLFCQQALPRSQAPFSPFSTIQYLYKLQDPPHPKPLLQHEQHKHSQSHLLCHILYGLNHFHGPALESLPSVHISPVLTQTWTEHSR